MLAAFEDDLASARRMLEGAETEKRPEVLFQVAREGFRWFTMGKLPKPDVIDAYHSIGLHAGLAEEDVQKALARAVAEPFVPKAPGNKISTATQSTSDWLVVRRASEIEPQPIRWLWPGRIALGKVTIVAGEPGLGKSQLTCAITATVTKGCLWPCGEGRSSEGVVIILSAEDDAADTIRPRLDAAGADVGKVLIVSAVQCADGKGRRSFNLQADLTALE
ncbi:MAG TPA: AAA family ATPase, partial [Fimbriimonadaceae bacterium]|nr:AAA family ATPase [Fimbriimonadaceae bacterium]